MTSSAAEENQAADIKECLQAWAGWCKSCRITRTRWIMARLKDSVKTNSRNSWSYRASKRLPCDKSVFYPQTSSRTWRFGKSQRRCIAPFVVFQSSARICRKKRPPKRIQDQFRWRACKNDAGSGNRRRTHHPRWSEVFSRCSKAISSRKPELMERPTISVYYIGWRCRDTKLGPWFLCMGL